MVRYPGVLRKKNQSRSFHTAGSHPVHSFMKNVGFSKSPASTPVDELKKLMLKQDLTFEEAQGNFWPSGWHLLNHIPLFIFTPLVQIGGERFIYSSLFYIQHRNICNWWNIYGSMVFKACMNLPTDCRRNSLSLVDCAGCNKSIRDCITWPAGRRIRLRHPDRHSTAGKISNVGDNGYPCSTLGLIIKSKRL